MNPKVKSFIKFAVVTLIGGFFLYFVFKGTDWNDLLEKFRQTNYWWISAGMIVSIFSHFLRAYRATMLYDVLGYKVPVKNSFYAVIIGYMMNYIIPRAGELSRCAALAKTDRLPVEKSLGTVITERVCDMLFLLLLLLVVFALQFNMLTQFLQESFSQKGAESSGAPVKMIVVAALVVAAGVLFLLRKKIAGTPVFAGIMKMIKGFKEGLMSITKVTQPFLFIVLSIGIWAGYILMMYFCFFAMEATAGLGFMECLTVFAIGTIGMVIPAPGAGAGTYHFFTMQALLLFGVPQTDGIAYATIVHGMQMVLILILGAACSLLVLGQQRKNTV